MSIYHAEECVETNIQHSIYMIRKKEASKTELDIDFLRKLHQRWNGIVCVITTNK